MQEESRRGDVSDLALGVCLCPVGPWLGRARRGEASSFCRFLERLPAFEDSKDGLFSLVGKTLRRRPGRWWCATAALAVSTVARIQETMRTCRPDDDTEGAAPAVHLRTQIRTLTQS